MTNKERIAENNNQLKECIALAGASGSGGSGGAVAEVGTASEMDAILSNATDADLGKVYYYAGASTDTYEQGALYMITKEE